MRNSEKKITEEEWLEFLESEFQQVRDIRLFLNLAQLGPGGSKEYMVKVSTEVSCKDFEQTFHDPKVFKIFMWTLESVREANSRTDSARSRASSNDASRRRSGSRANSRRKSRSSRVQPPLPPIEVPFF